MIVTTRKVKLERTDLQLTVRYTTADGNWTEGWCANSDGDGFKLVDVEDAKNTILVAERSGLSITSDVTDKVTV